MGFFDEYKEDEASGLSFVKENEKNELIADATRLEVVRVFSAQTQWGPRYVLVVNLDGEERALGFAKDSVESRDRLFDNLAAYLEREDAETTYVKLEKNGRSVLVRNATDEG